MDVPQYVRPSDADIRAKAREEFEDEGSIDFDDEPAISIADGPNPDGAYVAAWVWVYFDEEGDDADEDLERSIGTRAMYLRQEGRGEL